MENTIASEWRKCSTCKKPISFNKAYYECNVSTCTGVRTGYVFCTISCWEVHLPGAKHRNAGAIEKKSPTLQQFQSMQQSESGAQSSQSVPQRRIVVSSQISDRANQTQSSAAKSSMSNEVLVVVSKMKQHIRDLSDMNTSEDVNQILSDMIRKECEKAIENARADGRKTVMARDFK